MVSTTIYISEEFQIYCSSIDFWYFEFKCLLDTFNWTVINWTKLTCPKWRIDSSSPSEIFPLPKIQQHCHHGHMIARSKILSHIQSPSPGHLPHMTFYSKISYLSHKCLFFPLIIRWGTIFSRDSVLSLGRAKCEPSKLPYIQALHSTYYIVLKEFMFLCPLIEFKFL